VVVPGRRKHRAVLTTCHAAGLRISEAVALTLPAIDSQRMVLRVEQGNFDQILAVRITFGNLPLNDSMSPDFKDAC
jgi:site-specific recombinase XerD